MLKRPLQPCCLAQEKKPVQTPDHISITPLNNGYKRWRGLQLHWVGCTCYTQVGKNVVSAWAERALAGPVNGSCPPNPVPTSVCCQAPWVNAGMEKRHFLYKPHLFYIRHSQQPQKGRFLARRKPARTINRMCLTCSPDQFSQTCILSPCGILILHLCEAYKNIWLAHSKVLNGVSCSSERFIGQPALCLQWWLTK